LRDDVTMMLGVTSLMPVADEGCLHLGVGMEPGGVSPLRVDDPRLQVPVSLLVGDGARLGPARRGPRLSPPAVDELNTPATFTPTYSCGHFVFDAVGPDFALTAVDDLPTNGQTSFSYDAQDDLRGASWP